VRKSTGLHRQTCRSQHYTRANLGPVIKVRARQGLAEIDAAGLRPELPTPSKY